MSRKEKIDSALGKATVSNETFDEFLAAQGLLEVCEQVALEEISIDLAKPSPLPGGEGLGMGERGR